MFKWNQSLFENLWQGVERIRGLLTEYGLSWKWGQVPLILVRSKLVKIKTPDLVFQWSGVSVGLRNNLVSLKTSFGNRFWSGVLD